MNIKIYQVDSFTDTVFKGNPAAVCPLDTWLDDTILIRIAAENNLSETAFYVKNGNHFEIRWFTPTVEVDLCGHATLAAAYVLFNLENYDGGHINFLSPRSGSLIVSRNSGMLTMNFPTDIFQEVPLSDDLLNGFKASPMAAYKGKTDYLLVFEKESTIREMQPDFDKISKLASRGVIVTARGENSDFVSRFFAPAVGINEDPVTGSAHTTLIPYWSKILGKETLTAFQLSDRTGVLYCKMLGDRVEISGYASLYLKGEIYI